MEENEKAFTRAKNLMNRTFPGLLPLVVSIDYSFHAEDFIGVNRTGRVLLPVTYVSESDEFLTTAMVFSALYCHGFNLFDGRESSFEVDRLLAAVEASPWAIKLDKPEVRYLKLSGPLTYTFKKRAIVAALRFPSSDLSEHNTLRDLRLLCEENLLKSVTPEEVYAFREERFRLARLTLEDRASLLWDIEANQFDSEDDYTVAMGFLKRNFEEIHEVGMVTDFIYATMKAARHLGQDRLNAVRKQLLEPIIKGSKGFNYSI